VSNLPRKPQETCLLAAKGLIAPQENCHLATKGLMEGARGLGVAGWASEAGGRARATGGRAAPRTRTEIRNRERKPVPFTAAHRIESHHHAPCAQCPVPRSTAHSPSAGAGGLSSISWGAGCSLDPPLPPRSQVPSNAIMPYAICHQKSTSNSAGSPVGPLAPPPPGPPRGWGWGHWGWGGGAAVCRVVVPVASSASTSPLLPLLLCTRPARARPSVGGQSLPPAPR
jgi:hypothetical protein